MSKLDLVGKYGYFKMVLGMTRIMVEQMPDEQVHFRPTESVRTFSEIATHMYTFLVEAAETVQRGRHESVASPELRDRGELLRYMDEQVTRFFAIFDEMTDEQLAANVEAYGTSFAGEQFLNFAYDEHWHHRGQLTVYLRMCGIEPVMIYDYGRVTG